MYAYSYMLNDEDTQKLPDNRSQLTKGIKSRSKQINNEVHRNNEDQSNQFNFFNVVITIVNWVIKYNRAPNRT